jgi:large subunit ribosomal protein L25
MATTTLTANVRAETGKGAARKIRQAGDIPAVIYGHNREPQSLVLNARETEKLVRSIPVSSTAIASILLRHPISGLAGLRTRHSPRSRHPVRAGASLARRAPASGASLLP